MQALTLEVILRVVFGSTAPALRAAIAEALELTRSAPRLIAMSLGAQRGFRRAVTRVDAELFALIDRARAGEVARDAMLADLLAASDDRAEVRDQLVTLWPPGTRRPRPRWPGRSSASRTTRTSSPPARRRSRLPRRGRQGGACAPGRSSRSPRASWPRRSSSPGGRCPPACTSRRAST
jgi:hypothetical protein